MFEGIPCYLVKAGAVATVLGGHTGRGGRAAGALEGGLGGREVLGVAELHQRPPDFVAVRSTNLHLLEVL